ncbi:MAG: hypothetical protein LBQ75_09385 [Zoogloeaceae bacterium]|jgi:hypothetical protein|nr:hypothetical protein [Zoogloeaceae bacterium]
MDYTLRQLLLYHAECVRHENARQAAGIISANLGFAGGKAAKAALAKLAG